MRKVKDGIVYSIIYLCVGFTLLTVLGIMLYILVLGVPHINWSFLTTNYEPGNEVYGILPMIVSTLMLVFFGILIAAPIGIFGAIYLAEYAKQGLIIGIIRFATECLAGIPSIVYGLFGMVFFVTALQLRMSIFSGSLTVAIMVLPVIIRTTEEAIKAVPISYREAGYALGAGKLTVIRRIVLPSAIGGIMTGVILSVGRIVGETAAIIYTMGSVANMPKSFTSSGRTLSVHLYQLATNGTGPKDQEISYATAAVLLIIVFIINMLTMVLAKRVGSKGGKKNAK